MTQKEREITFYEQCEFKVKIDAQNDTLRIVLIEANGKKENKEKEDIKDVKLLFITANLLPAEKINKKIKKPAVFFNVYLLTQNNKKVCVKVLPNKWANTLFSTFLNEKFNINKPFTIIKKEVKETGNDKLAIIQDGKELSWNHKVKDIVKLNELYDSREELHKSIEGKVNFLDYKVAGVTNGANFILYKDLLEKFKDIWDENKKKYFKM